MRSPLQKGGLGDRRRAEGGNGMHRRGEEEDRLRGPSLCHRGKARAAHCHQGTPRAQSLMVPCPCQPVGTALPRTGCSVPPSSPSTEPQHEATGWTRAPGPLSPMAWQRGMRWGLPGWEGRRGQDTYSAVLPSQNNSSCLQKKGAETIRMEAALGQQQELAGRNQHLPATVAPSWAGDSAPGWVGASTQDGAHWQ